MEANEQVQTATKQEAKPRFKGSKRKLHSSDLSTPSTPPRPNKKTSKRQREGKEEEGVGHEFVSVWERLPNELLRIILNALDPSFAGIAARTCIAWFSCTPPPLRKRLCLTAVCSSVPLLRWAVEENGYHLDVNSSALMAAHSKLEVLQWARERMGCNAPGVRPLVPLLLRTDVWRC